LFSARSSFLTKLFIEKELFSIGAAAGVVRKFYLHVSIKNACLPGIAGIKVVYSGVSGGVESKTSRRWALTLSGL